METCGSRPKVTRQQYRDYLDHARYLVGELLGELLGLTLPPSIEVGGSIDGGHGFPSAGQWRDKGPAWALGRSQKGNGDLLQQGPAVVVGDVKRGEVDDGKKRKDELP